ncbi:DDE-1 domain-containing protein [Trichonephila clavipes]|nr:DDE-1 domain-containing protein [Trichonephila clavipes]
MKALKFYKELKESEPSTSSRESNPQFSASTGWLTGFIKRHFHNLKIKGEVASADEEAARKYPEKLAKIIKDGEYCAHQVFNADETGLFWKKNANPYLHCKIRELFQHLKNIIKFTFQFIFDKLESETITVTEAWKQFNILNCVNHVALAIAEIKSQTLNACWKAAWPECVSKGNESNRAIVISEIISIAKEIGGEGFDDFGEHDIEELLLVDEALNDDDILESMVDITKDLETVDSEPEDVTPLDEKLLREGLQLSGKLANFLFKMIMM